MVRSITIGNNGGFSGHRLVGAGGQVCEEATEDLPYFTSRGHLTFSKVVILITCFLVDCVDIWSVNQRLAVVKG